MQPYFFPYLGYFSLIQATDRWVVFDTAQYIRRGWVNRNRVLKRGKEDWKYIRIPIVKAPQETSINKIEVDNNDDWRDELIRNLDYYSDNRAPHYEETVAFLRTALMTDERNLATALVRFLAMACEHIGIEHNLEVFSEMPLTIGGVEHAGEWALRIAEALGATTYINAPGGREIFNSHQFASARIELLFLTPRLPPYDQRRPAFVPSLSIIDALMWNSRAKVCSMIKEFDLER